MTIEVLYGRYGGRYIEEFDTLEEAARWIESAEDAGAIFAAMVSENGTPLFEHEHPPSKKRWRALGSVEWPGDYA